LAAKPPPPSQTGARNGSAAFGRIRVRPGCPLTGRNTTAIARQRSRPAACGAHTNRRSAGPISTEGKERRRGSEPGHRGLPRCSPAAGSGLRRGPWGGLRAERPRGGSGASLGGLLPRVRCCSRILGCRTEGGREGGLAATLSSATDPTQPAPQASPPPSRRFPRPRPSERLWDSASPLCLWYPQYRCC